MRILALSSPSGGICGIGDYNAEFSAAFRAEGHQVDIVKLVRCGDRRPMVEEFRQRIANYDAVIFHFDGSLYGDTPFAISRNVINLVRAMGNKPGIAILHEGPPRLKTRKGVVSWLMRRRMMGAMNRLTIFVHSEDTRSEWIGKGVAPGQIKTITFPLQLSQSLVEPRPLGEADTVELLMFGFASAYKGYGTALNALHALPQNYCLTIAGDRAAGTWDDPTVNAIHGFIQTGIWDPEGRRTPLQRPHSDTDRQSLERRIKLTGHVSPDRVAEIMGRADIVLLPYLRSNGSAALADAIEFARPTIATALPAFCEVAAQAKCVRLVAPDAPFELAHAIRDLASNLDERRRMFASACDFARTHSFAALAQECISILSKTKTSTSNVGAMTDSLRIDHEAEGNRREIRATKSGVRNAIGAECVSGTTATTSPVSLPSADAADNANDPRHVFIGRVADGKSFIDVGGLSEVVYERISVAHAAGARDLALVDVEEPSCPWWAQLRERLTSRGVGECEFISADIMNSELPTYDVVHSSGVLYHLPAPMLYLARLRQMTREHCILTSTTAPTRLIVDEQALHLASASTLVVPALAGRERQLVVEWYRRRGRSDVANPESNLVNYYPNWFIPTVAAFKAMATCAGFAIVDEGPVEPEDLSYCLLLRPN